VDAASTSLEQHGWDIHALPSGAGGARVTEVRHGVRVPPYRGGTLAGNALQMILSWLMPISRPSSGPGSASGGSTADGPDVPGGA
jgi:hypothetical protein